MQGLPTAHSSSDPGSAGGCFGPAPAQPRRPGDAVVVAALQRAVSSASAAPGAGLNASGAGSGLPEEVPRYWQGRPGRRVPARRSRAGRSHVCGQMLPGDPRLLPEKPGMLKPVGRRGDFSPGLGRFIWEQRPLRDGCEDRADLLTTLPALGKGLSEFHSLRRQVPAQGVFFLGHGKTSPISGYTK